MSDVPAIANLTEFSLNVKKASFDNGKMRWRADTSDVDADLYNDNMTLELFHDFLERIERNEQAPEEFRSDFWSGGMPYTSVSHYPDLNGKAVPGTVEAVYIDGKFLKARGVFHDNDLGRKCFEALQQDLQQIKATSKWHDGRVRVSIAFLDWMHKHKSSGYVFERKSLTDICPECLKERMSQKRVSGKAYLKGQLVHLALTRVPVNTRTIMEVDKSMTTRSEDAASIVGEELASELEAAAKSDVSKAVLVEFSDAEKVTEPAVEKMDKKKPMMDDEEDDSEDEMSEEEKKKMKGKKGDEYKAVLDAIEALNSKVSELGVAKATIERPAHPLDGAYATLRASYDNLQRVDASPEDKLKMFQSSFDEFAEQVVRSVKPVETTVVKSDSGNSTDDLVQALSAVMRPLADKLELISTKLESRAVVQPAERQIPARRSIDPALVQQSVQQTAKSVTPSLRAIIERTT